MAIDPDIEDGPDPTVDPSADDDENNLALGDDDEEDEDEEETEPAKAKSKKNAKAPSVAEMRAQLEAANRRASSAAAALARERRIRKAAGLNSKGNKVTPGGAEQPKNGDDDLPEAAKARIAALEKELGDAKADVAKTKQQRMDAAIDEGLRKAGLLISTDDPDQARLVLKKARRLMDLDQVEIDEEGDVLGLDVEIDVLRTQFPTMFKPDVLDEDPQPRPAGAPPAPGTRRTSPDGGTRAPAAGGGQQTYSSTAEFLVSPAYKKRHAPR